MNPSEDPLAVKSEHCKEFESESLDSIKTEIKQEISESVDPISTEFIKEKIQGKISVDENSSNSPKKISFPIFPSIKGTTIKNEKRADFSLSTPNITDVAIVDPEREIPGKIAIA